MGTLCDLPSLDPLQSLFVLLKKMIAMITPVQKEMGLPTNGGKERNQEPALPSAPGGETLPLQY